MGRAPPPANAEANEVSGRCAYRFLMLEQQEDSELICYWPFRGRGRPRQMTIGLDPPITMDNFCLRTNPLLTGFCRMYSHFSSKLSSDRST